MSIVRKNNIGQAVIRFLVGLVLVAVVVLLVFKLFINKENTDTVAPAGATATTLAMVTPTPVPTDSGVLVADATSNTTSGTEVTAEPTATPIPTPEPTATPSPTPTPAPTATPVPASLFAGVSTKAATYPWKFQAGRILNGVTSLEIQTGESGGSVISLTGWGYANHEGFNGNNCDIWLMVLDQSNNYKCYIVNRSEGATGIEHSGAKNSKNLAKCDFTAVIDVSGYPDGDYKMGTAVRYVIDGNTRSFAYTFGEAYNFTVRSGVITAMGGVEN